MTGQLSRLASTIPRSSSLGPGSLRRPLLQFLSKTNRFFFMPRLGMVLDVSGSQYKMLIK